MDNEQEFESGDFVKVGCFTGVIETVWHNQKAGALYQILFVKNIIKGQGCEYIPHNRMLDAQTVSADALQKEFDLMLNSYSAKIDFIVTPLDRLGA